MRQDRKSTRLNSSHVKISYAVFCLKKKNQRQKIHVCSLKIGDRLIDQMNQPQAVAPPDDGRGWDWEPGQEQCLAVACFFFNDTATTEIYTLSLHDALPISGDILGRRQDFAQNRGDRLENRQRSEEHTSELQSRENLVCRLLLEKKKNT